MKTKEQRIKDLQQLTNLNLLNSKRGTKKWAYWRGVLIALEYSKGIAPNNLALIENISKTL